MKGRIKFWTLLLLLGVGLAACKPEDGLGLLGSKLDGINGTFTLSEVIQIDPFVIGSGNSLDITSVFTGGVFDHQL